MEYDDRNGLLHSDQLEEELVTSQPINVHSPKDKFYIVHTTFFLVGLSQLLPWNFLVTATGYWMFKFRDLHNSTSHSLQFEQDNKSTLQTYFDSYLSIASNLPFLLVFGISFINYLKRISDTRKNSVTFVSIIAVFITITSFVLVNTDQYQHIFLQLTLTLVFFLNSAAAYLQANFAGTVSLFPEKCMHLMVTGQATSGIFAASAQILSLIGNWSIVESTFAYFLFADLTVLFTFVLYLFVRKTTFYKFYSLQIFSTGLTDDVSTVVDFSLFKRVFKNMWPFCLTLMFTFWTTLSVFPALVVLVVPQNDQQDSFWSSKFFLPICCFFAFNVCDFLGRYLGRYCIIPKKRAYILLIIALSRIILVPLFMICNLYPRHYLPVLFKSEIFYIVFIVIFGLTNGYLVLNVFISGPLSVPPESRKVSGFFLIFFLGLGLTFGSLSSTLLVRIL